MEISIFLAKAWGLYLTISCLALLLNYKIIRSAASSFGNVGAAIFSGMVALAIGVLSVVAHNIWSADWRVLITLLGWLTLARGIFRLFFPQTVVTLVQKYQNQNWRWPRVVIAIFLILGVYLIIQGF